MKTLLFYFFLSISACGKHEPPETFTVFWAEFGPSTEDLDGNPCMIGHEGKLSTSVSGILRDGCIGPDRQLSEIHQTKQIEITSQEAKDLQIAMEKIDMNTLRDVYESEWESPDATVLQLKFQSERETKSVEFPTAGKVKAPSELKAFLTLLNDLGFLMGSGWSNDR